MTIKYICIHGHFYQPPRENPWLETIEKQDSAYPYHDWNERITAECYAPNSKGRILDPEGFITQLMNNYEHISFNFGPTLLSWFQSNNPELLQNIVEADKRGQKLYGGHGPALAQAYNHMIMPLANSRDKYTQIYWGIRTFEKLFERKPEGMWLPETAVDLETLDILSSLDIKFTILAPNQAKQVKNIEATDWEDVNSESINTLAPYTQKLPSGKEIAIFFYDGQLSKAVAFEKLLENGDRFVSTLMDATHVIAECPGLVHIATDGESYGHHTPHGDMALSAAINSLHHYDEIKLTVYAEFLKNNPPTFEVDIHENSSWSCAHGIERWKSHCGCHTGNDEWNQEWRGPLRDALDWLRDTVIPLYETNTKAYFKDPWEARNHYIDVVLDRSNESVADFINRLQVNKLSEAEITAAFKWLELQRHAMLMYTSCGWFFSEVSGIETVQILQYASRVLQLTKELTGLDLENDFLNKLSFAVSNIPENQNGKFIFDKFIRSAMVTLPKVAATFSINTLFKAYPDTSLFYCYAIEKIDYQYLESGINRIAFGKIKIKSKITLESQNIFITAIYQGNQNLVAAAKTNGDETTYNTHKEDINDLFKKSDFIALIAYLHQIYEDNIYTLANMFRDNQIAVVDELLNKLNTEINILIQQFNERNMTLIEYVPSLEIVLPLELKLNVQYYLNQEFKTEIAKAKPDVEKLTMLHEKTNFFKVVLDKLEIKHAMSNKLTELLRGFYENTQDKELLIYLCHLTEFIDSSKLETNLWGSQNYYYDLVKQDKIKFNDEEYQQYFNRLGHNLKVRLM